MSEKRKENDESEDALQHPIVHEGAAPGNYDSNEGADDRVEVQGPDGKVVSPSDRDDDVE